MKKLSLLIIYFFSLIAISNAQYKILHAFTGADGAFPENNLILSGNVLYGTADEGGANGYGCIFSIDTDGTNYKDVFDFNSTNGAYPAGGALQLSGNRLFGTVIYGGANDSGCVYSVNTDGSNFKDLLDFNGPNGAEPYGSVLLAGNKLFGMTFTGGVNIMGNAYTVDTSGHNYKDLIDFNGTTGLNPYGDFILIGKQLFSMTQGGSLGYGNAFSIDTDGSNFNDFYDFNGTDGAYPNNILTLGGNQFFGMTYQGGGPGLGNVFSMDTNGALFKDLVDFNETATPFGAYPIGDVILTGNKLFGMASAGGVNDSGCIFSVDTTGNNYADLYDFDGPHGSDPIGNLTISGNQMFGVTGEGGGSNYAGVIFSLSSTNTGIKLVKTQNVSIKAYPNPSNGIFSLLLAGSNEQWSVEVFDLMGQKVFSSYKLSAMSYKPITINLSSQPSGVYIYRALDNTGKMIGEGSLILQ